MTFDLSEGLENCKMSGKNRKCQGILRWMISDNPEDINKKLKYLTFGISEEPDARYHHRAIKSK